MRVPGTYLSSVRSPGGLRRHSAPGSPRRHRAQPEHRASHEIGLRFVRSRYRWYQPSESPETSPTEASPSAALAVAEAEQPPAGPEPARAREQLAAEASLAPSDPRIAPRGDVSSAMAFRERAPVARAVVLPVVRVRRP